MNGGRSTTMAFGSITAPTTPPSSGNSGASTQGSAASAASGKSTTTAYDLSQVHVRTSEGWVSAPWTHRAMVTAPFADFTWRHARQLAQRAHGETGPEVTETEIARALEALLTRADHGPDKTSARIAARTRTAATTHRPQLPASAEAIDTHASEADPAEGGQVIPFGVFDADAEAERWLRAPRSPSQPPGTTWSRTSRSRPKRAGAGSSSTNPNRRRSCAPKDSRT